MEKIVAELAGRLGLNQEQVKAELARAGGSRTALVRRLDARYKRACTGVERADRKAWNAKEAADGELAHIQAQTVERESMRRQRNALPVGQRVARVLADMSALQEGTRAASYEARVSGDKDSGIPKLGEEPLARRWTQFFVRFVKLAEHDLDVAMGRTSHNMDSGPTRDERILREFEGESATFAALAEGVSESHVRQLRSNAGRHGRDGTPREKAA